jgi:hypothetical protein
VDSGFRKWLENYEARRHGGGRGNRETFAKESWQSTKYDFQHMDPQVLQRLYLPELKMCFGPACSSLRKLWKSYKIASRTGESRSWQAYKIVQIERAMGLEVSQFPELAGMQVETDEEANESTEEELTAEEITLRREELESEVGTSTETEEDTSEWSTLDRQLLREEQEAEEEQENW